MVNLTINHIPVTVKEGTTILEAARANNIDIPSLCYLKDLNEIGACRVCCVEIEGENKLVPSCNNVVAEGMSVLTNSPRARRARRTNLELLLCQHDANCTACSRNGGCQLQKLAADLNINQSAFGKDLPSATLRRWPMDHPLIRDSAKCIKCMRCVQVCDKMQTLNIWDLSGTGSRTRIDTSHNRLISEADCSLCGQCITHCPTGALQERDDTDEVIRAIEDPKRLTVVQIAPAVRTALAEALGLEPNAISVNHLAAALKRLGIDYVFDTSFTADLTIMEEGTEFLHRLEAGELQDYPMFTSCCPGWVRFLKSQYPELTCMLSTAKSPQQMFGALSKSWFARSVDRSPEEITSISIMPCTAKKAESALPTMKNANGIREVDVVLTTREVLRMLQANQVDITSIEEEPFDDLMNHSTGAGVIFGATGGVMEAALRSAHYLVTGKNAPADAFADVRARESDEHAWREATFDLQGAPIRVAIASGLGNARALCEAILAGKAHYDFVEIMACPGGCSGGGGQPIRMDDAEKAAERAEILYGLDKISDLRYSHENPDVDRLYKEFLIRPNSHAAHELLHTDHFGWDMPKPDKSR